MNRVNGRLSCRAILKPLRVMSTPKKVIPKKELKAIAKAPPANPAADEVKRMSKATKIAKSGLNTRVRGHLKAFNKRQQGKRDSK